MILGNNPILSGPGAEDRDPHTRHAKNGDLSTTTDTIPPSAYRKPYWPTTKVTKLDICRIIGTARYNEMSHKPLQDLCHFDQWRRARCPLSCDPALITYNGASVGVVVALLET